MQKLTYLLPILGLLLLFTNCSKDIPLRSVEYIETKCSDPWKTHEGNTEAEVKAALIDFLENDLMIPNSKVSFTFDANEAQDCEACSCTTGRKIAVEVEEGYVAILEENGFTLIE